jgi:hypothetical protein
LTNTGKGGVILAYWGKRRLSGTKSKPEIFRFGKGVNTDVNGFEIDTDEATSSLNTTSQDYPALSTRKGFELSALVIFTGSEDLNGQISIEGTIFHFCYGTTWKKVFPSLTTLSTGLNDSEATFLEFTTASTKYVILFNAVDKKYYDGSSVSDIADVNCPATNIITSNDSRIFALKESTLYVSDIGDITNWTTGDADKIELVSMVGDGTALTVYNDVIIAWSDYTMHMVLGKTKDTFTVTEALNVGCTSKNSIVKHYQTGTLFWINNDKMMGFTGAFPFEVGDKIEKYLQEIPYSRRGKVCAGQSGQYIYISIPYGSGATENNLTIEYDVDRRTFYPWDFGFKSLFEYNNGVSVELYGLDNDGNIYILNKGTVDYLDNLSTAVAIDWEHTTGVNELMPLKNLKTISNMYAVIDLPSGSTLTLSYSTTVDNDDFSTLWTFTADSDEQNTRIRIPTTKLQNINWYRLKWSGSGPCKVHYLEVHGRAGA